MALLLSDVSGSGADGLGGLHVAVLPKVHEGGPACSDDGTRSTPCSTRPDRMTCVNMNE